MVWKKVLGLAGAGLGLGAVSSGLNFLGSLQNYQYQKNLQQHQHDLNIQGLKDSPLAQRQGLERAGFNPMLTYMNQSNATVSPAHSPASSSYGSNLVDGMSTMANFRLTNAQAAKLEKETENVGNTPTDLILNGIKGFLGVSGISNNELSNSLGKKLSGLTPALKEKLINFGNQFRQKDSVESTNPYTFKAGVSYDEYKNTNSTKINIPKFTPLEKKQLLDLEREVRSRKRSSYKAPPSLFADLPENY